MAGWLVGLLLKDHVCLNELCPARHCTGMHTSWSIKASLHLPSLPPAPPASPPHFSREPDAHAHSLPPARSDILLPAAVQILDVQQLSHLQLSGDPSVWPDMTLVCRLLLLSQEPTISPSRLRIPIFESSYARPEEPTTWEADADTAAPKQADPLLEEGPGTTVRRGSAPARNAELQDRAHALQPVGTVGNVQAACGVNQGDAAQVSITEVGKGGAQEGEEAPGRQGCSVTVGGIACVRWVWHMSQANLTGADTWQHTLPQGLLKLLQIYNLDVNPVSPVASTSVPEPVLHVWGDLNRLHVVPSVSLACMLENWSECQGYDKQPMQADIIFDSSTPLAGGDLFISTPSKVPLAVFILSLHLC